MQRFITHFVRERHCVWACIEPAELSLPGGRIQVTPGSRFVCGTMFMGIDLARMLEDQYGKSSSAAR